MGYVDVNKEIEKISDVPDDYGVLMVDLSLAYPSAHFVDNLILGFDLLAYGDIVVDSEDVRVSSVINHRYSNKQYATLSAKNGRYVCKAGYPAILPLDVLKDVDCIRFYYGYEDAEDISIIIVNLPVSIDIIEDAKYVCVAAIFNASRLIDDDSLTIRFLTQFYDPKRGSMWVDHFCNIDEGSGLIPTHVDIDSIARLMLIAYKDMDHRTPFLLHGSPMLKARTII